MSDLQSLTKEQFLELYGSLPVRFSSYYKYTFFFSGVGLDGEKVTVEVGGYSDDIYHLDVDAGFEYRVRDLDIGFWNVVK